MLTIETEHCRQQANPNGRCINRLLLHLRAADLGGRKNEEDRFGGCSARTVESNHEAFTFFAYETGKLEVKIQ